MEEATLNKFNLNFLEKKNILSKILSEDDNPPVDLDHITEWFTEEFKKKGSTAQGVGWRDPRTQELRYNALLDIFSNLSNIDNKVSVMEMGCAYGHIVHTLKEKLGTNLQSYTGLDINSLAISKAQHIFQNEKNISFENKGKIESYADYIIASGLFGFKGENDNKSWERYIENTLKDFHTWGRLGFAINFLSNKSRTYDERFYYADPSKIFSMCQQNYGYKVILNHSYLQNDFTIIVYK